MLGIDVGVDEGEVQLSDNNSALKNAALELNSTMTTGVAGSDVTFLMIILAFHPLAPRLSPEKVTLLSTMALYTDKL